VKHPDATQVGTFNGYEGEMSGEKIDYVFIQPTLEVIKAGIIDDSYQGRYPSDHFPVYAVVKIAQSKAAGPEKDRSFRKY
jgi:endonuclease/exonuclease/phosphatase family metal-dependent hydrolase